MDSLSVTDLLWTAFVVACAAAEALERRARRRAARGTPTQPAVVPEVGPRSLTPA